MALSTDKTYRNITSRMLPGTRVKAAAPDRTTGAARFVWNMLLDDRQVLYDSARMFGGKPPSASFVTLGKAATSLRRCTPWLREVA